MSDTILFESIQSGAFATCLNLARNTVEQVADATSPYEYVAGTRHYLWAPEDEPSTWAGFAIRPDGELVYVHAVNAAHRGVGDALVRTAVLLGATHLDCFDGYLTTLYSRRGFERVTSLPNWTPGGPDVVYMAQPRHWSDALSKAEAAQAASTDDCSEPSQKALPEAAQRVIDYCLAEAWANHDASDVHSEADVAADIVERLHHIYGVNTHCDPFDSHFSTR